MPQLSLYMDDAAMQLLRVRSKQEGVSLSKYARDQLTKPSGAWPESFWETYGAIDDATFVLPDDIAPELDGPMPSFD